MLILSFTILDRFNLFFLNNAFICNDNSQITSKNQIATKRSFNRATTLQKHNRYFVKSMKGTAVRLRLRIFSGFVWLDLHCLLCTQFFLNVIFEAPFALSADINKNLLAWTALYRIYTLSAFLKSIILTKSKRKEI